MKFTYVAFALSAIFVVTSSPSAASKTLTKNKHGDLEERGLFEMLANTKFQCKQDPARPYAWCSSDNPVYNGQRESGQIPLPCLFIYKLCMQWDKWKKGISWLLRGHLQQSNLPKWRRRTGSITLLAKRCMMVIAVLRRYAHDSLMLCQVEHVWKLFLFWHGWIKHVEHATGRFSAWVQSLGTIAGGDWQ